MRGPFSLGGPDGLAVSAGHVTSPDRALRGAIGDLRQLTFMDSAGVHAIIKADAQARSNARRLVLVRGPAQIDRLLELVGLSDQLEIIDLKPTLASTSALAQLDAA